MYESPINLIMGDMSISFDGEIMKAVRKCHIQVDEKELQKALEYDRHQYEKGYADGRKDVPQWIPCSERLPERDSKEKVRGWYLTTNVYGSVGLTKYEFESGSFGYVGWGSDLRIVAWKPLPEPWKGDD